MDFYTLYMPLSIALEQELGTTIYKDNEDGKYKYSIPNIGTKENVLCTPMECSNGEAVENPHTHGAYSENSIPGLSKQDKSTSSNSGKQLPNGEYTGIPVSSCNYDGSIWFFDKNKNNAEEIQLKETIDSDPNCPQNKRKNHRDSKATNKTFKLPYHDPPEL